MLVNQKTVQGRRNLEFSHIATSNHYLADVTGLLWLGVLLPELDSAREWRDFGLGELLREMDKQVGTPTVDTLAPSRFSVDDSRVSPTCSASAGIAADRSRSLR